MQRGRQFRGRRAVRSGGGNRADPVHPGHGDGEPRQGDAPAVPLLEEYVGPYVTMLRDLADALAAAWPGAPNAHMLRAAVGHALAFPSWQSLARDQGLTDEEAVELMTALFNRLAESLPEK